MVFVNSMSDLFHEDLPLDFIQRVFAVMVEAHRHAFQILTKRARRLVRVMDRLPWAQNIWMGVSVEDADPVCLFSPQRLGATEESLEHVPAMLGGIPVTCVFPIIADGFDKQAKRQQQFMQDHIGMVDRRASGIAIGLHQPSEPIGTAQELTASARHDREIISRVADPRVFPIDDAHLTGLPILKDVLR